MRFDLKATQYDRKAVIQRRIAEWLAEWLEDRTDGLNALELGAGTGAFTKHLASKNFSSLLASDECREMIGVGRFAVPQIPWEKLDAWDVRKIGFDRLYSCSLLQWCSDPLDTLVSWKRCLNREGRLLGALFFKGSLDEFNEIAPRFSAIEWRSDSDWLELLSRSGLTVLRHGVREDRLYYPSAKAALHSIHDVGAIRENRMGVAEMLRFLARCDRRHATSRGFPLSWKAMRFECSID